MKAALVFVGTLAVVRAALWIFVDRPLRREIQRAQDTIEELKAWHGLTPEEQSERLQYPFGPSKK